MHHRVPSDHDKDPVLSVEILYALFSHSEANDAHSDTLEEDTGGAEETMSLVKERHAQIQGTMVLYQKYQKSQKCCGCRQQVARNLPNSLIFFTVNAD